MFRSLKLSGHTAEDLPIVASTQTLTTQTLTTTTRITTTTAAAATAKATVLRSYRRINNVVRRRFRH